MTNDLGISLLGAFIYEKIHCSIVCDSKWSEATQMFLKRNLLNWAILHTLEYMQLSKKKITLLLWNDLQDILWENMQISMHGMLKCIKNIYI